MIVLYNPKATRRPSNRRLPLSVLSIAAVLEGREEYEIVDGNLDPNPQKTLAALMREKPVERRDNSLRVPARSRQGPDASRGTFR
jgi:hypothetical protein